MKVSLTLLPASRPITDRAMALAQQIRKHDPELANLLMRQEQGARKGTRGKRKVQLNGVRGKSGGFFIDGEMLKGGGT